MKNEFIDFLNALMEASPEIVKEKMTDNIKAYIEVLMEIKEKPAITEHGLKILLFLREHQETKTWRSKDIAERMEISSRSVSGSIRKLVTDGFVDKIGKEPCLYSLTEKGKEYNIAEIKD